MPIWEKFFFPSVPKSFDLVPLTIPEEYAKTKYGDEGFWKMCRWGGGERVRLVKQHQGEIVAFCGCDQEFFGDCVPDLLSRMEDRDFLTPNNATESGPIRLCADFQVIRCTPMTLAYQEKVYSEIGDGDDEWILNAHRDMVKWMELPRNLYWNLAGTGWTKGQSIPKPPNGMLHFHANWTVGLENKLSLLEAARNAVKNI